MELRFIACNAEECPDVVDALKKSLRDLENVKMIAPGDLPLLGRKREIQKKIERAEPPAESERKKAKS